MYRAITLLFLLVLGGFPGAGPASAGDPKPEGMFALYEQNRFESIPNYITEDFILLAYSMVVNESVTELEEQVLLPEFKKLVEALMKKLQAVDEPDEAVRADLDFLAVIEALLTGSDGPAGAADAEAAAGELKKIRAAGGLDRSDLLLQRIDYSQFKVRGKYTRSEALGRYFQAMRYAGTALFPVLESRATSVNAEQADRLTARAMALSRLIAGDRQVYRAYQAFQDRLAWLFGPVEDLAVEDYIEVGREMKNAPIQAVRVALQARARKIGRRPVILSAVVDTAGLEPGVTARDVLTGWRFMPQRFTPDSAAFQALVHDRVREYQGEKKPFSLAMIDGRPVKGFPLGLELMALLGSREAENRLQTEGETDYQGYARAAAEARSLLARPSGLPSARLEMINYWLARGRAVQPDDARRLNTCLAFWTWQRYISLLYAKQSHTMAGKGVNLGAERKTAWIEPAAELYLHLENQVQGLMNDLDGDRLEKFLTLLRRCRSIAFKELQGLTPDRGDVGFLNDLDQYLLPLAGGPDQPVVVDVHTEPTSRQVLEEAIGFPRIVTKEIGQVKARGALFTWYEFKQPMNDRLTDPAWRVMLQDHDRIGSLARSPGSGGTGVGK
ncbi:MAG: DUF3160 domain-containing protein [Proteobacteria bacterium]|nr:DUF3160 domain-containing protein [Pseudomonadota bacterium]